MRTLTTSLVMALALAAGAAGEDIEFNRDIRPLLSDRCFHCHGPDEHERQAELRLDQAQGPQGAHQTVIKPGSPEASELYAELADIVVGEPVPGGAQAKTARLVGALRELIDDVALPATLEAAGVDEGSLEMLAEDAMLQQRLLVNNPRDVAYEDALAIYRAAYRGLV